MCADAVRFAESIGYVNAGTVEFLLGEDGRYVFIEMNPRIQVEHTVTEEVTDIDLVTSQMRIAAGETFEDLGMVQSDVYVRGAALQCRITTEDPANGFAGCRPDHRLPVGRRRRRAPRRRHRLRRRPRQPALRLDARQAHLPRAHLPHGRAPRSTGVGGVQDPWGLHQHPVPRVGAGRPGVPARRGDDELHRRAPELLEARMGGDRGTRLLTYLADVTVNQPHGPATTFVKPRTKARARHVAPLPPGNRDLLVRLGPAAFASSSRAHRRAGHGHHLPGRPPEPARDPHARVTCCTWRATSRA